MNISPRSLSRYSGPFFLLPVLFVLATAIPALGQERSTAKKRTKQAASQQTHIPYDDSTLNTYQAPYAMPYNRWVDPAGSVVRFGDPKQENHSLDAVLLPGGQLLAVEDRFGIILFRTADHEQVARYTFLRDPQHKE